MDTNRKTPHVTLEKPVPLGQFVKYLEGLVDEHGPECPVTDIDWQAVAANLQEQRTTHDDAMNNPGRS